MISKNPAKIKKFTRRLSTVLSTLNERNIKMNLSNAQYIQLQDRLWRDFDTGTGRAG